MCRWLVYFGTPRTVESHMYEGTRCLSAQAMRSHKAKLGVHGDGGGLGWYGTQSVPGLYRDPGPAWNDPNLRELCRQIESRLFFAHVRASTGAPNVYYNCHPFRSGPWLFMHNGQIGGFPRLRRGLEAMLSDDCYAALQGGTDSELLFQLMITFGLETEPDAAIRQTMALVDRQRQSAAIDEPFRATFALSNGACVWSVRWSSDPLSPSLFQALEDDAVLLVSEPLDEDLSQWREIPANSLVVLESDGGRLKTSLSPLFEEGATL